MVEQLLERGEHVWALTRDPARAEFPAGVEAVRGDLADPASLEGVLEA
ncbi:NAD(P)H-binding protein OS=Streptomyces microflavus OX=1919 GN=HUT09_15735 PE=4 SV=1 [Streptomyces microflavus]